VWPLTRAAFARRAGVSVSTVTRALAAAARRHADDPTAVAPPVPVNPGDAQPRYWPHEFDRWWLARPTTGRPRTRPATPAPTPKDPTP
jgi:hypothetical protein